MTAPGDPAARPRARETPGGPLARMGEPLLATWTVAGALIALVYSAGPLREAVHAVPWLMGPSLWILTALGSAAILRGLPGHDYPVSGVVAAILTGGAADALVVIAGHPWPGLVAGVVVFSIVMARFRRSPACDARGRPPTPGTPAAGPTNPSGWPE